ncbi:hypothetical protein BWI96_12020 [Siphonobacter sp. SORGH_AS_0500]|nr:hypothetical protein BWI96_12020 [Siphonobacter sp. SORGH_AS_0500]
MTKMAMQRQPILLQIVDYPILPLEFTRTGLIKTVAIGVIVFLIIGIVVVVLTRVYTQVKHLFIIDKV